MAEITDSAILWGFVVLLIALLIGIPVGAICCCRGERMPNTTIVDKEKQALLSFV